MLMVMSLWDDVQVAKIETEKLLAGTIAQELEVMRHHGNYHGHFKPQFHSFGLVCTQRPIKSPNELYGK
jgi:hypothetical protein